MSRPTSRPTSRPVARPVPRPVAAGTARASRMALVTRTTAIIMVLLVLIVVLSLVAATAVFRRNLQHQYEQRALAIARSVAHQPGLATEVVDDPPRRDGPVERQAEAVRRSTGSLYVVVTDDHGIRYSHPNRSRIGHLVSTSPAEALAGHEVVAVQRGTLGPSARGKVPLRDATGRVVGEVSVGIAIDELNSETRKMVLLLCLLALVPLAVGLFGAVNLGRRLRRSTLGLQPEQMADLVREHEAVLHGVRDGVLAVDTSGRVTVVNPEAERLLGGPLERGLVLADSAVDPLVHELMTSEPPPRGTLRVLGDNAVLATRLPVRRDGRDLGQVLILRDRSDLDTLARELEATRALTDALRAQAHEHTNRLHALAGLLHQGSVEEAGRYLEELSLAPTWVAGVEDPYLAGLLAAKSAAASEAGVTLEVAPETYVDGTLGQPLETITVVANLLDNAIRAAAQGARAPARVELTLVSDGADLVVHVRDTGDGVPAGSVAAVFDHGFTSRPGPAEGHGLGLSLARHTARATGGDIRLLDAGGPPPAGQGAVFEARLRSALRRIAAVPEVPS